MYKTIVENKVPNTFDQINAGNYEAMIDGLAPGFQYRFIGDHPLAGVRTAAETMRLWWQRVFRVLPGVRFDVSDVIVQGHPINTRVAVRSRISAKTAPGATYRNEMMQFICLRLEKISRIETLEDTARLRPI